MTAHVNVGIPHAGEGTHTLVIALEVDDRLVADHVRHHEIYARVWELTVDALAKGVTTPGPSRPQLATVAIGAVARQHGLLPEELTGRSRARHIIPARQEAMWMVHRRAGLPLTATGDLFDRDHTTVLHGVRRVEQRIREDEQLASWLERVWQLTCQPGRRSDLRVA